MERNHREDHYVARVGWLRAAVLGVTWMAVPLAVRDVTERKRGEQALQPRNRAFGRRHGARSLARCLRG